MLSGSKDKVLRHIWKLYVSCWLDTDTFGSSLLQVITPNWKIKNNIQQLKHKRPAVHWHNLNFLSWVIFSHFQHFISRLKLVDCSMNSENFNYPFTFICEIL